MTSEDPIRIDASTVHRSVHPSTEQEVSGEIIGGGQSLETADGSKGSVGTGGVEEIAEANTVIRGSSRVEKPKSVAAIIDRTPAAVTKGLLGTQLNHFHLEAFIGVVEWEQYSEGLMSSWIARLQSRSFHLLAMIPICSDVFEMKRKVQRSWITLE